MSEEKDNKDLNQNKSEFSKSEAANKGDKLKAAPKEKTAEGRANLTGTLASVIRGLGGPGDDFLSNDSSSGL